MVRSWLGSDADIIFLNEIELSNQIGGWALTNDWGAQRKLNRILSSHEIRPRWSDAGLPQVVRRAALPRAVFRILDFYDEIIARSCKAPKDTSYATEDFCARIADALTVSDPGDEIPMSESMIGEVLRATDDLLLEDTHL